MKDAESLARDIFETGKLIQDHIFRARNMVLENMEKDETFSDLTVNQLHLMLIVKMHQKVSMTGLSRRLGVSPPSVSVMVDRLVEKGILVRQHNEKDRRVVEVSVSEEAVNVIQQVEAGMMAVFVGLVEKIGPETARQWHRVIKKVKPVLEAEAAAMRH